jgi:hypothetical protein
MRFIYLFILVKTFLIAVERHTVPKRLVRVQAMVEVNVGEAAMDDALAFSMKSPPKRRSRMQLDRLVKPTMHIETRDGRKIDVLMQIVGSQQTNGGFLPPPDVFKSLGIPLVGIEEVERQIELVAPVDVTLLVCTAVVLVLLEEWFGDLRDTWDPVITKSANWFSEEVDKAQPMVDGKELVGWARKYVLRLKRVV